MTKVYYIDPMFKEALEKVPPVIRKEVGFSFDIAKRIYDILKKNRINVTIRKEFGSKVDAACGQLRANKNIGG